MQYAPPQFQANTIRCFGIQKQTAALQGKGGKHGIFQEQCHFSVFIPLHKRF